MKKINKCFIVLSLLVAIGGTNTIVKAYDKVNNNNEVYVSVNFDNYSAGLTYDLSEDGTYYIVSNNNYGLSSSTLIIPEEYNGLPVKEIAAEGFAYRTWINEVYIPKTIEKIGSGAFSNTGIKFLYFNAKNCQDFKGRNWVFYPCDNQSMEIVIGKDVEKIPNNFCYPLVTNPTLIPHVTSLQFEEKCELKEIGSYAFYHLNSLTSINLPDSVTTIGDYAFAEAGITNLELSASLESIGKNAFANNIELISVAFPNSLKEIKEGAFKNCTSLSSIETTSEELVIGDEAFKYCKLLTSAKLDNVVSIGDEAFEDCINLKNLDLGNKVKNIGNKAFKNNNSLDSLSLPQSLESIGDEAFYGLYKLTTLNYNCTKLNDLKAGNQIFYGLGIDNDGVKVTFANNVEVIPANLFSASSLSDYLPNVKEIVIYGDSLTKINEWAFGQIEASVTYVGTIANWKNIEIFEGNYTLSSVNCVKEVN